MASIPARTRSEETRRVYTVYLNKITQFLGKNDNDILLSNDPRKIEQHIIDFIITMKEKGKGFSAIPNYISCIILQDK